MLLEDGEIGNCSEDSSSIATCLEKKDIGTSNARHRHLRAMFEQLRPEDTIKLVSPGGCTHVVNQISEECHVEFYSGVCEAVLKYQHISSVGHSRSITVSDCLQIMLFDAFKTQ